MKFHRDKRFKLNVFNSDGDCVASCGSYSGINRDPEELYREQCFHARLFENAPDMYNVLKRLQVANLSNDEIDTIIFSIENEPEW